MYVVKLQDHSNDGVNDCSTLECNYNVKLKRMILISPFPVNKWDNGKAKKH